MKKIEEELKTEFQSPAQKVHLNILFTASALKNYFSKRLRYFDLSLEQYNVLRIVRGAQEGKTCVKQISMRMIERSSNTTRIIDKLASKDLLFRQQSMDDKREQTIILTEKGKNLLEEIDHDVQKNPIHFCTLNNKEAETLSCMLDMVRNNLPSE
jgi:MarR family 2-MHQ and catechol resistance regulon transcriptional repressor